MSLILFEMTYLLENTLGGIQIQRTQDLPLILNPKTLNQDYPLKNSGFQTMKLGHDCPLTNPESQNCGL